MTPLEVHRALLGRNEGLTSLRAVVEARFSFAGRSISLPGVLLMQSPSRFRLELLDPMDRPLALIFPDGRRIVQYRPAQQSAAALALFPDDCRGVDPEDWVGAVLAGNAAPSTGEQESLHAFWGLRSLQRSWAGELRQSLRYEVTEGEPRPKLVSWYCGDDVVLQLKIYDWLRIPRWRLPSRFSIHYSKAGLTVAIEIKEIDVNPASSGGLFYPRIADDTSWSVWNLPR